MTGVQIEMIGVAGALLGIAISLIWYLPGIRAQKDKKVLKKSNYIYIALVQGFLFTCLLIILTEIIWDGIVNKTQLSGLAKDIISSFFRAALLEECFKFLGFKLAKKKFQLNRKIDYMMSAGLIGLVYGVVEKAVHFNIGAVVIGLAIPMHIIWQFNQGGHYYEYERLKAEGDEKGARSEWIKAIFVPFLLHGLWDSILDISAYGVEQKETLPQVLGGVLLLAAVVVGMIYCIRTVKKVVAEGKKAAEEPLPVTEESTKVPAV